MPFILMTGKKLDERNNYLKVTFKDNLFCVPSDEEDQSDEVKLSLMATRSQKKHLKRTDRFSLSFVVYKWFVVSYVYVYLRIS